MADDDQLTPTESPPTESWPIGTDLSPLVPLIAFAVLLIGLGWA